MTLGSEEQGEEEDEQEQEAEGTATLCFGGGGAASLSRSPVENEPDIGLAGPKEEPPEHRGTGGRGR